MEEKKVYSLRVRDFRIPEQFKLFSSKESAELTKAELKESFSKLGVPFHLETVIIDEIKLEE